MTNQLAAPDYAGDLGGGLVRRWSTAEDAEKLKLCLATVFRREVNTPLNQAVANEVDVMFNPGFPLMGANDFAIVEDTNAPGRPVVSCTCLWQERWSLGGIPFGVGRPELVATLAEYRNRGLVRSVFEMIHARSAARGDMVQAITGIEYFYRQFGYEYVLDLGGSRSLLAADIPPRQEGEEELYTLRPAAAEDAEHVYKLYEAGRKHNLVWNEIGEEQWRYYMTLPDEAVVKAQVPREAGIALRMYMIVDRAGSVRGFVSVGARRRTAKFSAYDLVMETGTNWQAAAPALLRGLSELGRHSQPLWENGPAFAELALQLRRTHPLYAVLDEKLRVQTEEPYAWYLRVADVEGFVRHIAPVLEGRLGESVLAGYSGELKLDLYRSKLRMQFEDGKLALVEPRVAGDYLDEADLGCPPLLFLKLLFGYRSLAELRTMFPDVGTKDQAAALLIDILFPKQPSQVRAMGYT
jgi:hypothetical protein